MNRCIITLATLAIVGCADVGVIPHDREEQADAVGVFYDAVVGQLDAHAAMSMTRVFWYDEEAQLTKACLSR